MDPMPAFQPDYSAILEKAIAIAVRAHTGQTDKGGQPYILHPDRKSAGGFRDEDEGDVDEDPSLRWYEDLPPFPYCHYFYDVHADYEGTELGPWLCMHGVYGSSRELVEIKCGMYSQ